ncbi:hypothetical protein [Streptomyces sp. D54]|uniref:hypothetical protein n=1 Tax=Streptomyces sp. D54 TaxID=1290289 RepID=UPI003CEEB010
MRADKRRIQTAVLGGAGSEEPLMLPMEAIELDAFRHVHESDTFWCGTLLGGCGGRLTTKFYTDRACHFAHHPDPDGLPHVCGRTARGVNSADHLYVKSAAAAWLADRGEQATFTYARPEDGPLGSVVDVRWQHGALRVHLDQAVVPVWDDAVEPVLGTMVPWVIVVGTCTSWSADLAPALSCSSGRHLDQLDAIERDGAGRRAE